MSLHVVLLFKVVFISEGFFLSCQHLQEPWFLKAVYKIQGTFDLISVISPSQGFLIRTSPHIEKERCQSETQYIGKKILIRLDLQVFVSVHVMTGECLRYETGCIRLQLWLSNIFVTKITQFPGKHYKFVQ